jgi:hypothetical protein
MAVREYEYKGLGRLVRAAYLIARGRSLKCMAKNCGARGALWAVDSSGLTVAGRPPKGIEESPARHRYRDCAVLHKKGAWLYTWSSGTERSHTLRLFTRMGLRVRAPGRDLILCPKHACAAYAEDVQSHPLKRARQCSWCSKSSRERGSRLLCETCDRLLWVCADCAEAYYNVDNDDGDEDDMHMVDDALPEFECTECGDADDGSFEEEFPHAALGIYPEM